MYHELTVSAARRKRRSTLLVVALVLIAIVMIALSFAVIYESSRVRGATSLRTAILESAKDCCAVEGSYPTSVQYLEDSYGLTINESDYVVSYEWYADNMIPNVAVVPR